MIAEQLDQCTLTSAEFDAVRDKISLFGALTEEQLNKIIPLIKTIRVKKDDVVFKQGQLPCNVYIVLQGEAVLRASRDDGSCGKMLYRVGDCFGETAVIGIQSQLGEARVTKDAVLAVLSRSSLLDIANTDAEIFGILMMNIAREVSRKIHGVVMTESNCEFYNMSRS